jgi:hypothetical protein
MGSAAFAGGLAKMQMLSNWHRTKVKKGAGMGYDIFKLYPMDRVWE